MPSVGLVTPSNLTSTMSSGPMAIPVMTDMVFDGLAPPAAQASVETTCCSVCHPPASRQYRTRRGSHPDGSFAGGQRARQRGPERDCVGHLRRPPRRSRQPYRHVEHPPRGHELVVGAAGPSLEVRT